MSGHSKWSQIRHKKAAADAKRGKLFTKLIREITIAAREGGGDPDMNPRLRTAIESAKSANMPSENIERAIKRGTGELEGISYEEVVYEGYGPGGVAILVEVVTDNKNRTVSEIRKLFSNYEGNLGESGCVAWIFQKAGLIMVPKKEIGAEELLDYALESGAIDFKDEDDEFFEIYTEPSDLIDVRDELKKKNVEIDSAELTAIPQSTVHLEGKEAEKLLKLMYSLEDHDDVQKVYSNMDIPDEIVASFQND
ncbi:YebC/PmpR family DNA-binding transcriptional regulator [bacterium]|nr:MAG: YebC/PmpR family DNA-binding transcriptional regulator [bacterium]